MLPISSLRFLLAAWVALGHLGFPVLQSPEEGRVLWLARALLNNAINAQAAVIVFFVISGFCIHFPNRGGRAVHSWTRYYARRYIRILIPMAAALGLALLVGMSRASLSNSVLWSLFCEEIYYFIYPALLRARNRFGWSRVSAAAWVLALAVVLTNPRAGNYPSYGHALNWILGLPCWLLGCQLAERFDRFHERPVSAARLWMWRGGAWFLSAAFSVIRFHTPIGFPWTLSLFAIYAALWLEQEMRVYLGRRPPVLEAPGEASYSLYLTHVQSIWFLYKLPIAAAMSAGALWLSSIVAFGSVAAIFYRLVERPSHRLARRVLS